MLTILFIVVLVMFLAGGGAGYSRWGARGLSPAFLLGIVLLVLFLTGRL